MMVVMVMTKQPLPMKADGKLFVDFDNVDDVDFNVATSNVVAQADA